MSADATDAGTTHLCVCAMPLCELCCRASSETRGMKQKLALPSKRHNTKPFYLYVQCRHDGPQTGGGGGEGIQANVNV